MRRGAIGGERALWSGVACLISSGLSIVKQECVASTLRRYGRREIEFLCDLRKSSRELRIHKLSHAANPVIRGLGLAPNCIPLAAPSDDARTREKAFVFRARGSILPCIAPPMEGSVGFALANLKLAIQQTPVYMTIRPP